jgi:hypothetical protein
MVCAHGIRAKLLLGLPLAAGLRGVLLGLVRRQPRWVPYFACFVVFNYVGLFSELAKRSAREPPRRLAEETP